jgi:protein SCO1
MKQTCCSLIASLALLVAGCTSESSPAWKPSVDSKKTKSKTRDGAEKVQRKETASKPQVLKPQAHTGLLDFELTERSGRTITRKDLIGKPAVVCFIFTQCAGPCNSVSVQMRNLQEWTKSQQIDVRLVSVSVDPKRDTPAVLREYAKNFGADNDRWWFLTGKKDQIHRVVSSSLGQRIAEVPGGKYGFELDHSLSGVLLDASGKIVGEYLIRDPVSLAQLKQRLSRWKKTGSFDNP